MEGVARMNNYMLPFVQGEKIIELGGGTVPMFRPNLDVRAAENVDIVADFNEVLPIEDGEYDGVFSKFCIEHISWRKVKLFLEEVYRILSDNGKAVFITANTERQMEWVLEHDEWDKDCSCIIFGDQDYADNTHRNSLNPKHAIKLCREVGFDHVIVIPWGDLGTDMLIEAYKKKADESLINIPKLTKEKPNKEEIVMSKKEEVAVTEASPKEERKELFDAHYFNGGGKVGGYAYEGYWDYPVHWITFNKLMDLKPESVLEIGAARGYIVKRFEAAGIPAKGMEISKHCHLTRVTDSVVEWDICQTPWPFEDGQFDLCYSIAVMEHIPEEHLPKIIEEMKRVSKRGLHGIDFGENDDGFDKTHCTLRTKQWWDERLPKEQVACDKEDMEKGSLAPAIPSGDGKLKLNVGSYTVMFHNGWLNLDIIDCHQWATAHHYKFLHMDASKPMRLDDNVVDLMLSSHMLEHLNWNDGLAFLKEAYRVLKPGGVLRLSVPDAEKIIKYYNEDKLQTFDELNVVSRQNPCQSFKLWSLLFEGHKIAYDWQSLSTIAKLAGFKVERKKFNEGNSQIIAETMDFLPDLSLYVEMHKI
jgi:predicted SAM-dependent methyltransferase